MHIIDNTIDIDVYEYDSSEYTSSTLSENIIMSGQKYNSCVNHMLNNRSISNTTFNWLNDNRSHILYKYKCLVEYLTKISLGRFTRFYNTEKYYDTCIIVLLIMKIYQRLPNNGQSQ